jgi:hypothetical protein
VKPPRIASGFVLILIGCSQRASIEPLDAGPSPPAIAQHVAPAASEPVEDQAVITAACPPEMVLVEGSYCPDVRQTCLEWMDPPGPYEFFRCARYGVPVCASPNRVAKRFCIDCNEYMEPGASFLAAHHSWTTAK